MSQPHICQVAISAFNAAALRCWYRKVFNLAKGAGILVSVPPMPAKRIQGIHPNPVETVSWLIDRQDFFQLEFFQFHRPRPTLRPAQWRPCDIGYNLFGLVVQDFDATISRVHAYSDGRAAAVAGEPGRRRAVVQDPEGNWLELLEFDPLADIQHDASPAVRPELSATARFIRISVPDLAVARHSYGEVLGLEPVDGYVLHSADHEGLWGLPGARCETQLLRAGNFLVELVRYHDPLPAPRPDGYQLSDQGFMNIALGFHQIEDFNTAFSHSLAGGFVPNGEPVGSALFTVMYVNDPAGFSVELLQPPRNRWWLSGFAVGEPYVEIEQQFHCNVRTLWDALTDHAALGGWSIFDGKVLREGLPLANGPGCLRQLSFAGARIVEEVTEWRECEHFAYRLRKGAPLRNHRGDLWLTETPSGSQVRWAIRFEPVIPFTGLLTAWLLKCVFARGLRKLSDQLNKLQ